MTRLRYFLALFLALAALQAVAQDTLSIMHYNLLNYGVISDYCNNTNNNINDKDSHLRTIIDYKLPDILTVNEISRSQNIQQRLLDNVLNTGGRVHFRKGPFEPEAESDIVNMLYYNEKKLTYYSHVVAQSYIRDIDIFTLYYNADDLDKGDTVFIHCIVAHLKAGSGVSNSNARNSMAAATMDYLESNRQPGNYLLLGDLNVYSDEEPAYGQFAYFSNAPWRFHDPLDRQGPWSNNPGFSDVHTQSTHSTSAGCASPGGMDDRFDFILVTDPILTGSQKVQYVPESYHALGQDGEHFNKSIISFPSNTSVPSNVLYALYYNSDHLPVTMEIIVDKALSSGELTFSAFNRVTMNNPVKEYLSLAVHARQSTSMDLSVINLSGQVVATEQHRLRQGVNRVNMHLGHLAEGFYLVRMTDGNGRSLVKKLLVN